MYRLMSVDQISLDVLLVMSTLPPAGRAWRAFASEILQESNLLNVPADMRATWIQLVSRLLDQDKERLGEILRECIR